MSFMLLFLILLCNTIIYWVLNFSSSAVFLFFVFLFFALRQFRCSSHITYRRTFCASRVTCPLKFCVCCVSLPVLLEFAAALHAPFRDRSTYLFRFLSFGPFGYQYGHPYLAASASALSEYTAIFFI